MKLYTAAITLLTTVATGNANERNLRRGLELFGDSGLIVDKVGMVGEKGDKGQIGKTLLEVGEKGEYSANSTSSADTTSSASDDLGDKCYTLESQTILPTQIVPIKTAQNASTFYGYDNKSPPNDLSSDLVGITNGALVLLHQDTTTDIVSLIFLDGNTVPAQLLTTGFVVFTGVDYPVVIDDVAPPANNADPFSYLPTSKVLTFKYIFGAQKTDGIVAPLTLPLGKCATVNLSRFTNVDSLEVDDGTGSNIVVSSSIADEVLAICRSKCEE